MSRRQVIVATVAVVVLIGVATTAFLLLGPRGGDAPAATAPPTLTPADTQDADAVAVALRGLATDPGALVASAAREQVGGQATQAVPPGSTVTPDSASWAPDGVGGGTMTVTLAAPGQPATTYAVVMVREGDTWKVLATVALDEPSTTGPAR